MGNRVIYAGVHGFKNRIINGDLAVWQRGTSFVFPANTFSYTADRFRIINNADGQFTVSKNTINGRNSIRIYVDSPPTDLSQLNYWYGFGYRFEGQHLYDIVNKKGSITISFIFKSNVPGEYSISLRNLTYTGQTGAWDATQIDSYVTTFQYTTPDIPQKVEATIPLNNNWTYQPVNDEKLGFILNIAFLNQGDYITPSTDVWINGANYLTTSTAVNWAANIGNYIELTELQVEEGESATEFEYVPYDVQLLRCMRYYEQSYEDGVQPGTITYAGAKGFFIAPTDTNNMGIVVDFIVPKRVIPSVTVYSPETGASGQISIAGADLPVSLAFVGKKSIRIGTGDTTTLKRAVYFHYVAIAEL